MTALDFPFAVVLLEEEEEDIARSLAQFGVRQRTVERFPSLMASV